MLDELFGLPLLMTTEVGEFGQDVPFIEWDNATSTDNEISTYPVAFSL
jgi:hypothetical protein